MLRFAGVLCLALSFQVFAVPLEYVEVGFPENVQHAEAKADTPSSRIVSGWESYPGQHPHQVHLRITTTSGTLTSCGGSIVHEIWVLSAAHCIVQARQTLIQAGVTDLRLTPQHSVEASAWFMYPGYDAARPFVVQPDELTLIRLASRLTFSQIVQPIKIQPAEAAYTDFTGQRLHASGWGYTWTSGVQPNVLNWVYLSGVSDLTCLQTFGSGVVNRNTVCARYFNQTTQSTCQGDSGGPLVQTLEDGTSLLVGVTSFVAGGNIGCHSGFPAGFIRAGAFHEWYTQVTGIDFDAGEPEPEPTPEPEATPEPTPEPSPEHEPEESDEDSEEDLDDEDLKLLKRLEVLVKVKVRLDKHKKKIVVKP